jgi:hypothetical protein
MSRSASILTANDAAGKSKVFTVLSGPGVRQ